METKAIFCLVKIYNLPPEYDNGPLEFSQELKQGFRFIYLHTPDTLDQDFNMNDYIDSKLLPDWFVLPQKYVELLMGDFHSGDFDFGPSWQLLYGPYINRRYLGLKERFPSLNLYPFARRIDDDDIVCFNFSEHFTPPKIIVIHDFCALEWAIRGFFENFDAWLESAKNEMK